MVPPLVPTFIDVPSCHALLVLARRELDLRGEVISHNQVHAGLLFHMLNRREAVESSQIEGTHTSFDGLLIHEIQQAADELQSDTDADVTLELAQRSKLDWWFCH